MTKDTKHYIFLKAFFRPERDTGMSKMLTIICQILLNDKSDTDIAIPVSSDINLWHIASESGNSQQVWYPKTQLTICACLHYSKWKTECEWCHYKTTLSTLQWQGHLFERLPWKSLSKDIQNIYMYQAPICSGNNFCLFRLQLWNGDTRLHFNNPELGQHGISPLANKGPTLTMVLIPWQTSKA